MFRRKNPNDQRPETIPFSAFTGLRNTVTEERLEPTDLADAVNVDIDDVGQLHRRRGRDKVADGDFHSLSHGTVLQYGVKDNTLGVINPDYSFISLVSGAGADPLSYVQLGEDVYFSSLNVSGIIRPDLTVSPWGEAVSEGVWHSPVVNPTATLSPISGKLLGRPPMASVIAHYGGRMLLANRRTLWCTELYAYSRVDKTRNYVQFEADITMIGVVDDGVYVGTEAAVWFLTGPSWPMKRTSVVDEAVIPGSMIPVPGDLVDPAGKGGNSEIRAAIMFMTAAGLCVGMDGGSCYNLTQTRYIFPDAVRGAAMFRSQDGVNQYVGVLDSGGSPTSTARFGDFVDAEIVRFKGA